MDYISGIEAAFKKYIGDDSIQKLQDKITNKPMILIAGDQLTGKSTQAKNLAKHFLGSFHSVGALFREAAKNRGITVAEQARLLLVERGIDVEIDYKTCQVISGASIDSVLGVVEGRQPAYMGSFMASLGKTNIVRLYLKCSIREQALRFLRREVGEDAYIEGRAQILDKEYNSLESINSEIKSLNIENKNKIMADFIENQSRDEDDRHRYSGLYGFDYGNLKGYDIVINTNDKEPGMVFDEIIVKLNNFGFRAD